MSEVDPNLYYIMVGGLPLILVLYVDDLILTRANSLIQDCKADLAREFEMKDIGLMHYFLGLEVWQGDGSSINQKSTSGGIFSIGSAVVCGYSRKLRSIALSSIEVEYMVANLAACKAIWTKKMLVGLFKQGMEPIVIHCDNHSCIKLSENQVFHDHSRHIEIKYHHIRDYVQKWIVKLSYIPTEEHTVDILTKALVRSCFVYFRDKLGVVQNPFLAKREC
eukprot:PITA_27446